MKTKEETKNIISKIDKREVPLTWLFKFIFYDLKIIWIISFIFDIVGFINMIFQIIWFREFDRVNILIIVSAFFFYWYFLKKDNTLSRIYDKELHLNHFYDYERK